MRNSAFYRRDGVHRRRLVVFLADGLDVVRVGWRWLAYLTGMTEPLHGMPGLEPVLTTSELAAYLGVLIQTIHDLRHAGRGPRGFRIGRQLRYRVSEVRDWLTRLEEHGQEHSYAQGVQL